MARLLGFTAENLLRLAIITEELEDRGEDLSQLRFGLLPILRQIAMGTLLPQVVVMFAGQPVALKRLSGMPLKDQEAIANGTKQFELYPKDAGFHEVHESSGTPSAKPTRAPKAASSTKRDPDGCTQPNLIALAKNAGMRDLAEMIGSLIAQRDDAEAVVQQVLVELSLRIPLDRLQKAAKAVLK